MVLQITTQVTHNLCIMLLCRSSEVDQLFRERKSWWRDHNGVADDVRDLIKVVCKVDMPL